MNTTQAVCPACGASHSYSLDLIGRYTLCHSCRCRFYIEVPTLGETQDKVLRSPIHAGASSATTLDELLWDTQQGSQHITRLLRRLEAKLQVLIYLTAAVALLIGAGLTLLLVRPGL